MCRVLAYLGPPVLVDDLLYRPDSSLVRQSVDPKLLHMLNLGGFGMMAWDPSSHEPSVPYSYRSTNVPVFDSNLKGLALKLRAHCLLAHVRGVAYHSRVSIGDHNLHPFRYEGFRLALAHNGDLHRFGEMKYDLVEHIHPAIRLQIRGTTDSEWMYALLMSQVEDPTADLDTLAIAHGLEKMLTIVRKVRARHAIRTSSPVNLFLCDGNSLVGVRFTFDFGCYPDDPNLVHEANLRYLSAWYTLGSRYGFSDGEWKMIGGTRSADSVIVASEPLTRDASTWLEVPEYSLVHVDTAAGRPRVETVELDV
jgi:glutamine amidotransferase